MYPPLRLATPPGGFAPHPGHDAHLHPTLSAVQILLMQGAMDLLDRDKIVKCEGWWYGAAQTVAKFLRIRVL